MSLNCGHQWTYVHPQVIYEHGEPWYCDNVSRQKLLTHPPEPSGNPAIRDIW
jgi:hypothetical protein